jgi:hypothetical protein
MNSSDSTMTTSTAQQICNFDSSVDPNLVEAVRVAVASVSSVRSLDASAFSAASSQFVIAAPLALLVALFNAAVFSGF